MSTTGGPEVLPDFYKDELERDQIASLLRQRRLTANEIVEGLWHGQVKVRRNAARGLQLLQDPPAPGEVMLRISAKDADEKVRAEIIGACAMGVGGTAVAVPILFDALMDKGEGIRDTALQGLERRITQKATEVVPYYVSAMSDVRPLVSSVAVRFLIQAGGMLAVGALVPMLGDQDPRLRRAAFDVLDRLKWQAVGPLIEALRDPNARELAVKLLSGLGTVDKKHMQALDALLANATSSGDEGLRVACEKVQAEISRVVEPPRTAPLDIPIADFMQRALSDDELPADSDVALDEVLHALRDGRAHVRQNAAAWLGRLASAQEKADLVLLKLAPVVRDGDVGVRVQVARALASFGGARPSRLLVTALGDPQADVRQAALQALVALGPDGLAGALDAVGTETPRPARTGIEHAAARLGTATVPVLADVLVAGAGMSAVAREVAANALGSLGKAAEEGISALLGALLDPLEDVRAAAAQALGFVGVNDEAVMAALGRCLKDPVANVRRQAALAASRITGKPLDDRSAAEPRPIPVPGFETEVLDRQHIAEARGDVPVGDFVRALRDGRDIVKRNAATAIGGFGEAGGAGAAPMAILLRDGDVEVRRAAVEAYLALGKAALPAAWFLTAALNDPDAGVKDGVIDVLVALHPEAADFLIEALRTDLEVARKGVFNVWYRLGHAGVPDLGRATQSSSGLIRVNACWALEMLARRGADAAQGELEARLGDVIGKVRVAAQAALDAIGGGKPQPPKVLEPDPVAIPDFDATLLDAGRIQPHLGEVTVERMVRALRDGRPFVRANAVTALGLFAADGAADAAADAIGALGSIAVAARDSAIEVRRAACEALAQVARAAAASRPDDAQGTAKTAAFLLVTALEDRADKVRDAARAGLTGLGASALPALVEGLLRPADVAKHSVMPVFAALGAAALPALRAALDADSPLLRAGALRALRVIGREHATLAKADVERLKASSDDQVRAEASATLDHIEGRDVLPVALSPLPIPAEMQVVILPPETVRQLTAGMDADLLLKATHDGREVVRANAARALGFVENPPKRVAGGLAILLRAPEPAVREAAVEALQELGPKHAAPAAFFLAVALDEPEPAIKDRMMTVLASLHDELPEALIDALRVDPDSAPLTIIPVFDRIGRPAIPTLGRALKSSSGLVRINAAQTLEVMAKKGAEEVLDILEGMTNDPIKQARVAAALAADAIKGGKPKPPRVLEIDPVAIRDFDQRMLDRTVLDEAVADGATTAERMVRALRDGRPFVRSNAVTALGAFGAEGLQALQSIAVVARDSAIEVRRAAATTLGRLAAVDLKSDDAQHAMALLVTALEDKFEPVREAAKAALAELGEAALPALVEALGRAAVLPRFEALAKTSALAATLDALRGALGNDSSLIRAGALRALRLVGRTNAEALKAEVEARKGDPDDAVRAEAQATLDHIAGKDVEPAAAPPLPIPDDMVTTVLSEPLLRQYARDVMLEVLLKALQDGRDQVKKNAARTLGFVSSPPKRVGAALAILLRDSDAGVREAAVEGLETLGPKNAAPAAFWLAVALNDPEPALRGRVVNLMASLHEEDPSALIECLRVDPEVAPSTIIPVFDVIGGRGVPTLVKALKAPSGLIRINAAMTLEALARKGADQAWDDLEAALADPIKRVRTQAALAMDAIKGGKPRPPKVLEPDPVGIPDFEDHTLDAKAIAPHLDKTNLERLKRALADGRPWMRANAATALGLMGPDAADALARLAVAGKDESIDVRRASMTALGALGLPEKTAPILVTALADRAASVRKAAREALSGLGEKAFPALALGLATSSVVALEESLVPLLYAFGDNALQALVHGLDRHTPELHAGALRVLIEFKKDELAPHRDAIDAVAQTGDPQAKARAVAVLDKIDGKADAPSALEPTPLPLPDFDRTPYSRAQLQDRVDDLRLDLLVHALYDGRDLVRQNAAIGLGLLESAQQTTVKHLVMALKDPSEEVRVAAAEAFGHLKPRRDVAIELVVALDDASPRVVRLAEQALAAYGEFAIDAFMYGLDDEPELVGRAILPMLANLGEKAMDALVLALRYESPLVRRNALIALRLIDKDIARAARPTISLMKRDENRNVRLEVRKTLDYLDDVPLPTDFAEPLVLPTPDFAEATLTVEQLGQAFAGYDARWFERAMSEGRRKVRENAVRAHQALGVFHPHLAIRLKDEVEDVQHAAAETLLALGMKALPAATALVEALGEQDELIRKPAADALFGFGPAALPALIAGLWVAPDLAKRTVTPLLVKLAPASTPAVIAALEHPSQLIQLNALKTLALLYAVDKDGSLKGMPRVIAMLRHPLPAVIGAAQKALFRLEGRTPAEFQKDPVPMPILGFDKGALAVDVIRPEAAKLATDFMLSALADGREVVRENASRASGFLPKAADELLESLGRCLRDSIPAVQIAAAEAFGTLKHDDAKSIPALTFALRDTVKPGGEAVRRAIFSALDNFGPKRCAAVLMQNLVGREDWMLITIGKVAARMHEVFVPALVGVATNGEVSLIARENAVRILGDLAIKARPATQALLTLLPDMQGMLAAKAVFAISRVAAPEKATIDALQKRLQVDPRPSLHHEILQAVKILKRKQAPGQAAA